MIVYVLMNDGAIFAVSESIDRLIDMAHALRSIRSDRWTRIPAGEWNPISRNWDRAWWSCGLDSPYAIVEVETE